jgi:ribosome biogenesis GTPase
MKRKIRVDFRKNRSKPARDKTWTRGFEEHKFENDASDHGERVRTKGELSRKRTIVQDPSQLTTESTTAGELPSVDTDACFPGRVLRVHGLYSIVETDNGYHVGCSVRRLLKTLATDARHVVAAGDRVWIRLAEGAKFPETTGPVVAPARASNPSELPFQGVIERIQARHGVLGRSVRGREHVLVANLDQVFFVVSVVEPELKVHLVDRYLAAAQRSGFPAIVCLNKIDLAEAGNYQRLVGGWERLGVEVMLTSARTNLGISRLKNLIHGKISAFSGQSGVGKSSLLNAIEPDLGLRVREVSEVNAKGKHTTTTNELFRLKGGGWVADTPGVRQFDIWQTRAAELEGLFADFCPFVSLCAFPDCTHTHEGRCAVRGAVDRRLIHASRYHSYLGLLQGRE